MKKALQIDEVNARKLYPTASSEFKTMLEGTYGKDFFSKKIIDRITIENGYLDACADQGIEPLTIAHFSFIPEQYRKRMFKHYQQNVIADSLNEGWIPNWRDHNQPKYYPLFKDDGAGFGFSGAYFGYWHSCTSVGSRLYFKTSEIAKHAGIIFAKIGIE